MTEGRIPKGEPEPPDSGSRTTNASRQMETADEPEVQAYQEPASEMGEPEPPDTDG